MSFRAHRGSIWLAALGGGGGGWRWPGVSAHAEGRLGKGGPAPWTRRGAALRPEMTWSPSSILPRWGRRPNRAEKRADGAALGEVEAGVAVPALAGGRLGWGVLLYGLAAEPRFVPEIISFPPPQSSPSGGGGQTGQRRGQSLPTGKVRKEEPARPQESPLALLPCSRVRRCSRISGVDTRGGRTRRHELPQDVQGGAGAEPFELLVAHGVGELDRLVGGVGVVYDGRDGRAWGKVR